MSVKIKKDAAKQLEKCIVVGAGSMAINSATSEEIRKCMADSNSLLIAVDGGAKYCLEMGLEANVFIGDFDSADEQSLSQITKAERAEAAEVIRLPKEKDDTDMLAALKYGMEQGCREFYIYGGYGGRLDHTLANIQCLLYLKRRNCHGCLLDQNARTFVIKDEEVCFGAEEQGTLSLFSLNGEAYGVSISGLKYPLENDTMTNDFPIGISNEFIGLESRISVEHGELAVMISNS